jgi:hypothetical protein
MAVIECKLCRQPAERVGDLPGLVNQIICERCGKYFVTLLAEEDDLYDPGLPARERAMLSGVTRERSEQGRPVTLAKTRPGTPGEEPVGTRISELLDSAPRLIPDKIDRALLNLARKSPHPGAPVNIRPTTDWPLFFAENGEAMGLFLRHMVESSLLEEITSFDQGGGTYALTVKGWERVGELRQVRPESRQVFVAMWFNPQMNEAYENGFQPAIKDAGYNPLRVDRDDFNERIDDYIIAQIKRSCFLVADVTGHRQAVYFEAGFAMGLRIPVIFTCHKDHLGACNFDTRQYNHIIWESADDLREKLRNRIEATIV